jgi:thiol:disulfide interchange protein DsbD
MGYNRGKFKAMKWMQMLLRMMAILLLVSGQAIATPDFLPPEKAFLVDATWLENSRQLEIQIAPVKGYYVYRESLQFRAGTDPNELNQYKPALPAGVEKFDQTFQKTLQIYPLPLTVSFDPKIVVGKPIYLEMELQGCAVAGICYPPMTLKFFLAVPGVKAAPIPEAAIELDAEPKKTSSNLIDLWHERDDIHAISAFLESTSTAYLFLAFFILGLALAFTPCVLPMLPILSSVIFGTQGGKAVSKARASVLAIAYVLGMALIYALAGVLMAALGGSVQRALQSPLALAGFALLLLLLSGSLFGLYDLRLPQSWHQHIDRIAGRQKGGSILGAFVLGGISTLVASPCITAPLAGVLAFIAQTGSMTLGASLLFVMALGMGIPLLLIAIEARILIPSTGIWMIWLQRTLGVLLVATAFWIASPLFQRSGTGVGGQTNGQVTRQIGEELRFTIIQSVGDLDRELAKAKTENKLLLLDFYADWCISCKEMEVNTFANPEVAKVLREFVLVQADVTKNSVDNQALLKRFGLFGPPGILIFDVNSQEEKARRVIGYMPPERFLGRLKKSLGK